MKRLSFIFISLFVAASCAFSMGGSEESDPALWPQREITVICPWAVGGVADIVNRSLAPLVQEELGVAVLATNEPGAGGNVALSNFAVSENDGYTFILGCEGPFSILPNLEDSDSIPFSYSDFENVVNYYSSIMILTANAKLGLRTIEDIREYGRENRITVAVNGVSGAEAFLIRSVLETMDLDYVLINYNGANLALAACSRGETDLAVSHQSQALSAVESGDLIPILVFDEKRTDNEPFLDVPCLAELGYRTYFPNTACLMAKKGTDPEIIEKLRTAYLKALDTDEIEELYETLLIEKDPMAGSEYDEHIERVVAIVRSTLDE